METQLNGKAVVAPDAKKGGEIVVAVADLQNCSEALHAIDRQITALEVEYNGKLSAIKSIRESTKADWIQARDRVKALLFPKGKPRGKHKAAIDKPAAKSATEDSASSVTNGTINHVQKDSQYIHADRANGVSPLQIKILGALDSAGCPMQIMRIAQIVGSSAESVRATCKTLVSKDEAVATDISTYKITPNGIQRYKREKHLVS